MKKETLGHKLVEKAEKLKGRAGELVEVAKKKRTVKQKLVSKTENLHRKAGELVVVAKKKESVDDKLTKTTERLKAKTKDLEKMNSFMIGRELKMVEQKKEIAELKEAK